jgi:predicted amidohydrolase YtcJ
MVFGFFEKAAAADLVIVNGHIYTQDNDNPWVEAVACKDGKVLAIGTAREMDSYTGKATEVLDLQGHYMAPGFIDAYGTPVLDVFSHSCLFLDDAMSIEAIISILSEQLTKDTSENTFFAYGYHSTLLRDLGPEKSTALLDELNVNRPILLLSKDGYGAWINTIGIEMAKEAAEEEGIEILNLPFTISVLNPFSYEEIQTAVINQAWDYASKGYTGIYNSGSPDIFDNIYQNVLVAMDQEGLLPQRHYGALSVMTGINSDFVEHKLLQNRTKCIELDELINFNTLKLYLNPENRNVFSDEYLKAVCESAMDRGFDVEIQVIGKDVLLRCLQTLGSLKIGGTGKSSFTVSHNESLTDAERYLYLAPGEIIEVNLTPLLTGDNEQILESLTIGSAEKLALIDKLGSIEIGKYADFVIFESNPFEGNGFPQVAMTLVAGDIAFDKQEDHPDEWNRLVSSQSFDDEDLSPEE